MSSTHIFRADAQPATNYVDNNIDPPMAMLDLSPPVAYA